MKNYIIPIFIPHYGCPNMCVFCNQVKITGSETPVSPSDVNKEIAFHLNEITRPYHIEAAFYGGSFTALTMAVQNELLEPAFKYKQAGKIHAIRLSTRPDAISEEIVENLIAHGVTTLELGVQSLSDAVLKKAERGHTAKDVYRAVQIIKKYREITLGLQIMPGLPNDTRQTMLDTMRQVIAIKPSMVRIYPTVVLENTKLAEMYKKGSFTPLDLDEAVEISAIMKQEFEKNAIKVIRTGLQSADNLCYGKSLVAGPYHPAFGEMVESHIFYRAICQLLDEIKEPFFEITLYHSIKDTSKIRGLKNKNTFKLKEKYNLSDVIYKQADFAAGHLKIAVNGNNHVFIRNNCS